MADSEQYFTVDQVAGRLQVSTETVRRLLTSGKLQGFKVGDLWRVRESDLAKFVTSSAVKE